MKSIINLFFSIFICSLTLFSCKNESKSERKEEELLKKEKALQDSILAGLTLMNNNHYEFFPTDTIIELQNETDLILWENSFVTTTGDIYRDQVKIEFSFSQNPKDILFNKYSVINLPDSIQVLKGIIRLKIKDKNGSPLYFNPNYSTVIRFWPSTKMHTGFAYFYDTMSGEYHSPLKTYKIFKNKEAQNGLEPDREINLDFISDSGNIRPNSGNNRPSKQELIGYELTLKYPGIYYISRRSEQKNLKKVDIEINLKSKEILNWEKTKVFLFSQDQDYNYYLRTEYLSDGRFKVIPSSSYYSLELPLDYKYTVMAYHIEGDQCYFAIKKNLTLSPAFSIDLNLKKERLDKLINIIKNL